MAVFAFFETRTIRGWRSQNLSAGQAIETGSSRADTCLDRLCKAPGLGRSSARRLRLSLSLDGKRYCPLFEPPSTRDLECTWCDIKGGEKQGKREISK